MKINIQNNISILTRMLGQNFSFFRRHYFSHYHKSPDADFHKDLTGILREITTKRGSKYAIAAPRESAKSTIVSLEYVIYCICYKIERYIVIISSTNDQATGFLGDIKKEFESNELLIQDFPNICEVGKPPRWTQKEIVTRNNIKVLALGTGQQIRGRRNREFRPSLIILDDIETNEETKTAEGYYKLHDWVTKSVLKAGTATTNVICIGTIHHYNSLLAQLIHPNSFPGWEKRIYRSIISWSSHPELWETWTKIYNYQENYDNEDGPGAAERFFNANKEDMLEGVQVLWPQHKSYHDLMIMREQEGYISFDSEMQNEPVNPRDCHFNLDEVRYWDDRFESEEDLLATLGDNAKCYGSCDPSLGKQNRRGDFSAIITAIRDKQTGIIYIVDADISRRLPDKTIDDILVYHQRRNYERFAFEVNQFQEFMRDELEKRGKKQGLYLTIEDIQHSTDKLARIETLQPMVKSGSIQFSKKHRTLLDQMKFFPKGQHDDGLDALEMVVKLAKGSVRGPRAWFLGDDSDSG